MVWGRALVFTMLVSGTAFVHGFRSADMRYVLGGVGFGVLGLCVSLYLLVAGV